jgi:hypothetical protein
MQKVIKMALFKKTIPLFPWSGRESIYEFIRDHIDRSGNLAYEFDDLPDGKEYFQDQKFRWVGGAMDSLTGGNSKDAHQIARRLYWLLRKQVSKPSDGNRRAIYLYVMGNEIVNYIDLLLDMIHQEFAFNGRVLKQEAVWLATKSAHRNPVKLGIALLGIFQCDDQLDVLYTLGKHDEFTLYSVVAICNGVENHTQCLFELAKHIDGWGKINLVQRLEPDSEEIKAWLLRKGCQNRIMNEYLAYTCAVKGDLAEALEREDIELDLYKGAGVIVEALINGGPAEDMDDYEQSRPVIVNFLRHSKRAACGLDDFLVIASIRDYLEQQPEQWVKRQEAGWTEQIRTASLADCIALLERNSWPELVWNDIASKDGFKHYQAVQAGRILNLDIWPTLFEQLKADPMNDGLYYNVMRAHDRDRIAQVVEFAENNLPLEDIASGPKDETVFGPEFKAHNCLDFIIQDLDPYEGMGKRLISAALWSPSTRNRNMALKVLKAWKPEYWPDETKKILIRLQSVEPNMKTKEEVIKLLREC